LGNPGKEYSETRHNAGFKMAEMLYPGAAWQTKFNARFAREDNVMLLMPLTYMNLSGTAVSQATTFFRLKSEEVAVFHDDLELPFGTIKVEKGGPLHGHNGLRSIKERIGSDNFYHVRIGIGRPKHGDVALYVTSAFTKEEKIAFCALQNEAEKAVAELNKVK
jgi:peptidyl-tRNA hydrolase